DVGEDRAGVYQVKPAVLERQVRRGCVHQEVKRRRQMRLAPGDALGIDIDAPVFRLGRLGLEPSEHAPGSAAQLEDALAGMEAEPLHVQPPAQEVRLPPAAVEERLIIRLAIGRNAVPGAQAYRGQRQSICAGLGLAQDVSPRRGAWL